MEIWKSWVEEAKKDFDFIGRQYMLSALLLCLYSNDVDINELKLGIQIAMSEEVNEQFPERARVVWTTLSNHIPDWSYAALKASDLSLSKEMFADCEYYLERCSDQNDEFYAWSLDIRARLSVEKGDSDRALEYWRLGIKAARENSQTDVVRILEDRFKKHDWRRRLSDTRVEVEEKVELERAPKSIHTNTTGQDKEIDAREFERFIDQCLERLGLDI